MLIITIAVSVLLSLAGNQAGACDDYSFTKLLKGASRYEYRGRYVNRTYRYSVKIPQGLTGYDGRDEANHQGFGLALGEVPQGYLFVRGAHNSLEFDTPTEAATRTVEYMRQDGKKVESETTSESQLGALNAVHLVVIYTCPGSSDRYIYSSINALSPTKGFVYTIELYSVANRYKSDRPVLDRIIKSWQMLPSSRHQPQR